ncbi:MAG: ACT domain-containing protein [Clostridia bacterium]|nr:ACT domain-containing protein [Clostridia bacterium]
MQAVITVTGKDTSGIVAAVSAECAAHHANISDITQSVVGGYFVMIMIVDIDKLDIDFSEFVDVMTSLGKSKSLVINTMHGNIFDSMHKI